MKRFLIKGGIALAIATLLICGVFGCAAVKSGSQTATNMICSPPASVMTVVDVAAPIVAEILNLAVPGSSLWINSANAVKWIADIQNVGCIAATDLNSLIGYLTSDPFKTAQVTATKGKAMATITTIDVTPLELWSLTAKK